MTVEEGEDDGAEIMQGRKAWKLSGSRDISGRHYSAVCIVAQLGGWVL